MDRLNEGLNTIGSVAYVADGAHSEAGEKAYVLGQTEASVKKMAAVMLGREELEKEPAAILPEPWKSENKDRINIFTEISTGTRLRLGYHQGNMSG